MDVIISVFYVGDHIRLSIWSKYDASPNSQIISRMSIVENRNYESSAPITNGRWNETPGYHKAKVHSCGSVTDPGFIICPPNAVSRVGGAKLGKNLFRGDYEVGLQCGPLWYARHAERSRPRGSV